MKLKNLIRNVLCLIVGGAACVSYSESQAKIVDELSGLRPNTEGVETNKFWDTRAHATFTVQVASAVSTTAFDTSVMTQSASRPSDIGKTNGLLLIFK